MLTIQKDSRRLKPRLAFMEGRSNSLVFRLGYFL